MFYDREEREIWPQRPHRGPGRRWMHHRMGMHGLHRGRKFSSNDLQIVILALLEKGASYGYEVIKSLEELSDGYYVPSPGMVYPALTYLEEIGYTAVDVDGQRKRYRLTDEGQRYLEENRERASNILSSLEQIGARMEDARRAFTGESGEEVDERSREWREARHELRDFIRGFRPRSREDEARMAEAVRQMVVQLRHGHGPRDQHDREALLHFLRERRSMGLSRLRSDPVDRQLLDAMMEAANWAPSHGDTEPWRFFVFSGDGRHHLADLFEAAQRERSSSDEEIQGARKRAFAAPVWIAIGMSPQLGEDGTPKMSIDEEMMAVACAVQNLHLMACALGLVGMWHSKGLSVNDRVAAGLGLTAPSKLLGFFMCGWPAQEKPTGERGPWTEKVTWYDR